MSAQDMISRRKMPPPMKKKGSRDEELALFAEMHKREKDRLFSLLQPVSDDSIDGYSLYHRSTLHGNVPKGPSQSSFGYEKIDSKNDYDWLKTPPVTPLFPSLETEPSNGHTLVVQRELPILQPLSRFSGTHSSKTTPTKKVTDETCVATKGKAPPRLRSVTPTPRIPTISSSSQERKTNNNISKLPMENTQKLNKSLDNYSNNIRMKPKHMTNINGSSLSKSMGEGNLITTSVPDEITKIPSNLRTSGRVGGRSYSASRGRPGLVTTNIHKTTNPVSSARDHIQGEKTSGSCWDESSKSNTNTAKPTMKSRQSCSPSVTRGRKSETEQIAKKDNNNKTNNSVIGRTGTQFVGSKMVDKIMNARNVKPNHVGTAKNKNKFV